MAVAGRPGMMSTDLLVSRSDSLTKIFHIEASGALCTLCGSPGAFLFSELLIPIHRYERVLGGEVNIFLDRVQDKCHHNTDKCP